MFQGFFFLCNLTLCFVSWDLNYTSLILAKIWCCYWLGSLKYWYERNKVNISVSKEAVWDDDAVARAIDCAEYWVKNLPFVRSLCGDWKFFLASNPNDTPPEFYDTSFQDSTWNTIPGNLFSIRSNKH